MKRSDLVEFLNKNYGHYCGYFKEIVDGLIKEGFVEVIKPREFWLVKDLFNHITCHTEKPTYAVDITGKSLEIIHVREVTEQEPIKDENLSETATFTYEEMKRFTGENSFNNLLKPQEPTKDEPLKYASHPLQILMLEQLKHHVLSISPQAINNDFDIGFREACSLVLRKINLLMKGE